MRWILGVLVGVALGVAAYLFLGGQVPFVAVDPIIASATTIPPATTTSTSTTVPRSCGVDPASPLPTTVSDQDPTAVSIGLVAGLTCSDHVIVADALDPGAVRTAARISTEEDAPILFTSGLEGGDVAAALARLDPRRVTTVGLVPTGLTDAPVERVSPDLLDPPPTPDRSGGHGLLVVSNVSPPAVRAAVGAAATMLDSAVVTVDPSDLRLMSPEQRAVVGAAGDPVTFVGDFDTATASWELGVARNGLEIPGGGQVMFPGRRLVALYGSPGYPSLGVLGEQSPEESVARARQVAEGYGADGTPVLPAFEIIATIASAGPGADGDYSGELTIDELRPLVEAAAANGVYVILDLQPGRTDFLTQAKYYEELLKLPYVGLALDPEWRLGPNQVHLRQIGTVDAAEINTVVEWLAGIVRQEALPQKLLLLHQFKLTMITNREKVETPPELAVVVQMDGQGPLGTKYDTWHAMLDAGPNPGWRWGWKNFYDEDSPMATPAQVLDLDPVPVYVSFQ